MKKLLVTLLLTLLGYNIVQSQDWININSPVSIDLTKVKFLNSSIGLAVGREGVVLKTTNGGISWVQKNINQTTHLSDVCFIGNQIVLASGIDAILRSTDLGESWIDIDVPALENFMSMSFLDQNTGFACGSGATIIKTTNGGLNWQLVSQGTGGFYSCKFFDVNNGVAINSFNVIKKTTNGGVSWFNVYTTPNAPRCMFFNGSTSFVSGWGGYIFKTTNNGTNWSVVDNGGKDYDIYSGSFLNQDIGLFTGPAPGWSKGIIFKTLNGGNSWVLTDSINGSPYSMDFAGNYAVIVCDSGKIFRSSNPIGIREISSQVPDKYSLSQNYPNPFNPTTNIEFSVPKTGAVKLTVFDLTGREISTLVKSTLSVGKYRVDFNAGNLSSGTYFYRLETDSYVLTKKMVLVK